MKIIRKVARMQAVAEKYRTGGKTIGLVPTMGYLHEGHLSLMRHLRSRCDILVTSIFVNPAQFGPQEDLDSYPRDFDRDRKLCRSEKVDIVFYPDPSEMYPSPYRTFITVDQISDTMCGRSRPGHFRGVATVVAKLFNIIKPQLAIFGQKDYQQLLVIQQMVRDLNFDIRIIRAPIIREADGLAMSSRNRYLSVAERQQAIKLFQSLQLAHQLFREGVRDADEIRQQLSRQLSQIPPVRIDYIAIVDPQDLKPLQEIESTALVALAVYVGKTRLIDNMMIP